MPTFLKTTESYRQGARTLPGRYYTAPEILAEEQERIFRPAWDRTYLHALGHESPES